MVKNPGFTTPWVGRPRATRIKIDSTRKLKEIPCLSFLPSPLRERLDEGEN